MRSSALLNYVAVGLVLLLTASASAASRGSLVIPEKVSVEGKSLPAGEYSVKWEGDGPNVELNILHDGKLVATVPAHTIELKQKDQEDSVLTKKSNDGTESLFEIHFSGKRYAFAVGGEQAPVNAGTQE
jgi:hypothetical protein